MIMTYTLQNPLNASFFKKSKKFKSFVSTKIYDF